MSAGREAPARGFFSFPSIPLRGGRGGWPPAARPGPWPPLAAGRHEMIEERVTFLTQKITPG